MKDKIQEAIYGLYPYGFVESDVESIIQQIQDIYPTVDSKLIFKVAKEYLNNE